MPSRDTKKQRKAGEWLQKAQVPLRPVVKPSQTPQWRAGNATRINAFVNSLGRRAQAKRDAR